MKWGALFAFGGPGLVVFVVGVAWGYQRYALYREGASVQGRVVERRESRSSDSDVSLYPVVEFVVADGGAKIRFTCVTGYSTGSISKYEIGSTPAATL